MALKCNSSTVLIGCRAAQAAAEWPQVQEAVAKLCLAWWQAEAPGRTALVPQTLPYLLVRALTGSRPAEQGTAGFLGFQPACYQASAVPSQHGCMYSICSCDMSRLKYCHTCLET